MRASQGSHRGTGPAPEPFWLLDLFEGITGEQSAALERAFPARRWIPGDQAPAPEGGADLAIVRGGLVAVMSPTVRGRPVAVALLQAGDVYLACPEDSTCHLEALEQAWVSTVASDRLGLLLERAPALATRMVRGLAHQLEEAARAAGTLSEMRVEDRLMGTFVRLAMRHAIVTSEGVQLSLRLSHAQWATLVGASREAVTAALIRLRRRGSVRTHGRVIVLPEERVFGRSDALAGATGDIPVAGVAA